ncbi:hypothetical protein BG011_007601 [Mortierella polycephala]|uniref:SPRY-domain-containing protein n=1 Tax=Mortierella polycephala TaxID=41804 RepID=A0A9P6PPS9_9FUNG|nr:hypothetical protein BG011_007601 [Mortierella polycephala]
MSQREREQPARSASHEDHEEYSDTEADQTHNPILSQRRPLPSLFNSSSSLSSSASISTSALTPSATVGDGTEAEAETETDINANENSSSDAIATTDSIWPSVSDRGVVSLSALSSARRYPQLPLRTAQHRILQHHYLRRPHIPLPEREDSSRPRTITFGTLKKASMANRSPTSGVAGKMSKMAVLPSYLLHTTFVQHFQPEGSAHDNTNNAPTERLKRRRLHFDSYRRRHHRHYQDSDSSCGDSSSSGSSSSGSESGHSAHENESGTTTPTRAQRPLRYQLPSRWSNVDKTEKTMLSEDDLQVHYIGPGAVDSDAAAIRTNRPIPPQCGVYYFEVFVKSKGQQGYIGVGVCNSSVELGRLPGWELDSWGYHGDDGNIFGGCGNGRPFGPVFTTGDMIGCGINFRDMSLFYTLNGDYLGVAFRDLRGSLYPTVGMRTTGEVVEANFGQQKFMFDIESYVKEQKVDAWQVLEDKLQRVGEEKNQVGALSQSLSQLVLSYMIHHGYSETARQFSSDLIPAMSKRKSTEGSSASGANDIDSYPLVVDTERRKVIRNAIMSGDIDMALELLDQHYPTVMTGHEETVLQLRCRKFIEMVAATSVPRQTSGTLKPKKEQDTEMQDSEPAEMMDVDQDVLMNQNKAENVELEGLGALTDVIQYGQLLHQQYKDNRRQSVQDLLVETFSVLAYSDIANHVGCAPITREKVAESVNAAILASQNLPTTAPLETVYRQTSVVLNELTRQGAGEAAFFDLAKDCME